MNKIEHMAGRFVAVTEDMCNSTSTADVDINTSCEHISQDQYKTWLNRLPARNLIVLQSNNYQIDEHVRVANSLDHFIEQSEIEVSFSGELQLPLYKRFMIIGRKSC